MKIDRSTLENIASLSRLELSSEEMQNMRQDFEAILTHFEKLSRLQTDAAEEAPAEPALRGDEASPGLSREQALSNTKDKDGFRAPATY